MRKKTEKKKKKKHVKRLSYPAHRRDARSKNELSIAGYDALVRDCIDGLIPFVLVKR